MLRNTGLYGSMTPPKEQILNSVDYFFILAVATAAFAGWKLRSLVMLGIGFALVLAPAVAEALQSPVAASLGTRFSYFDGQHEALVFWMLIILSGLLIFFLFHGLSRTFESLLLGGLDKGFGALILGGALFLWISYALIYVTPQLVRTSPLRQTIQQSYAYQQLSRLKPQVEKIEKQIEKSGSLKDTSQKKGAPKGPTSNHPFRKI
jgi:hypothetical protein